MKKILVSCVLLSAIFFIPARAVIGAEPKLNIGGTYLGLYNYLDQKKTVRGQFDFAVNLDIEYSLSERIKGIVQFQGGNGVGSLGIVGPGLEVTDLNLEYTLQNNKGVFTFGSFDTPFGEETKYQTNNADAFNNNLLLNSLLYSAISGPVGTLNTLGIKFEKSLNSVDFLFSVSNGTGENAINDNTYEYLISLGRNFASDKLRTSVSFINSNDLGDTGVTDNNSLATHLSGLVWDVKYNPTELFEIKGYVGQLNYDDNVFTSKDKVTFWMIEGEKMCSFGSIALRVSQWLPEDNDGAGSLNATLPNPGLSLSQGTTVLRQDSNVTRVQLGFGVELERNLMAKTELILDSYEKNSNTMGLIMYLNGKF